MGSVPGRWLAVMTAAALLGVPRTGRAAEVEVDCTRLDAAAVEELSARARLLLRTLSDRAEHRVTLHCDADSAWLTWDDSTGRMRIDESTSLIEGTLDAIEASLLEHPSDASHAPSAVRAPPPPPARNETPDLTRPLPRAGLEHTEPSARRLTPGGVGLSIAGEWWEQPSTPAAGPHFDVAVGSGELSAVVAGGFSTAYRLPRSAFVVDTQVGIGWGAPYVPGARLGAVAMVGGEWFAGVTPDGSPSANLTSAAVIATLGARATLARVGSVALWLGLDGRARIARQRIGSPLNYSLLPVTLFVDFGGFVLVDG